MTNGKHAKFNVMTTSIGVNRFFLDVFYWFRIFEMRSVWCNLSKVHTLQVSGNCSTQCWKRTGD